MTKSPRPPVKMTSLRLSLNNKYECENLQEKKQKETKTYLISTKQMKEPHKMPQL